MIVVVREKVQHRSEESCGEEEGKRYWKKLSSLSKLYRLGHAALP